MAGRGRGRDSILPAWMTGGGAPPQGAGSGAPLAAAPSAAPAVKYKATSANSMPVAPKPHPGARPAHLAHVNPAVVPSQPKPKPGPVWVEYKTPEGKPYYHNRVTNVTSWEKPPSFTAAPSQVPNTATTSSNGSFQAQTQVKAQPQVQAEPECVWKEYQTNEGKKYYHNTKTGQTVWDIPEEFKASLQKKVIPEAKPQAQAQTWNRPQQVERVQPVQSVPQVTQSVQPTVAPVLTREQANTLFIALLNDKNIDADCSWDSAMKIICNDERYRALKTLAERKAVFSSYCAEKQLKDREQRKEREKKQKDGFLELLRELHSSDKIGPRTSYKKLLTLCPEDVRYTDLHDRDREEMFEDFVYELEKQKRENDKAQRKENMQKLRVLFEEDKSITFRTSWRSVQDDYRDNDVFLSLSKADRLTVFEGYFRVLERVEEDNSRRKREETKRQARLARDAFRQLLRDKKEAGELTALTHWRDFKEEIKDTPAYTGMLDKYGSAPSELFYDFKEDLYDLYREERRGLKKFIGQPDGIVVDVNTTFDQCMAMISACAPTVQLSDIHKRMLYEELLDKAKFEIKEAERRANKEQERKAKDEERAKRRAAKKLIDHFRQAAILKGPEGEPKQWDDVSSTVMEMDVVKEVLSSAKSAFDDIFVQEAYASFVSNPTKEDSEEEGLIRSSPESSSHRSSHRHSRHRSHHRSRDRHSDDEEDDERKDKRRRSHKRHRSPDSDKHKKRHKKRHKKSSSSKHEKRDKRDKKRKHHDSAEEGERSD